MRTCPNAPIGGTGFFVIPGTETCLQVSGYVRAEYRLADKTDHRAGVQTPERGQDAVNFFTRGSIAFDARTPTEYGTLRSFIRINADRGAGIGAEDAYLDQGFIQFAGLTAGRITSFFSFFGTNTMSGGAGTTDPSTEVLAYTATFGSGFSATVSVENAGNRRAFGMSGIGYGGQDLPDLVANLNVSQAWGSAQIMGALHQIRHDNVVNPLIDDEMGWAVGAGLNVRLPMIAAGDALWLQATYADGALSYVGPATAVSDFALAVDDATLVGNTLDTSTAWALAAAFRHFWTPTVWQDIEGRYGQVDQPIVRVGNQAAGTAVDYSWYQVGTRLNWRPTAGLTFSADVVYTAVDTEVPLIINAATGLADDTSSAWAGRLRIQRDF